jgi:hypothetical protein
LAPQVQPQPLRRVLRRQQLAATPEQPAGFLGGNWLIDKFHKGGPIMWPILIVSIVALTVVLERCIWWGGRWFRRDPKRIEKVFTAD